jgi:hypothetical protein
MLMFSGLGKLRGNPRIVRVIHELKGVPMKYFPLLATCEFAGDPYLRGFYQNLLARGKARLQAVVAVMRKLLHALFAMFRTNQPYDGSKLCAADPAVKAVAACA